MKLTQKLLFGVPIAVGVYLIARQFLKKKGSNQGTQDVTSPAQAVTPILSGGGGSSFPIKKGSVGSIVKTLQTLLNGCGASPQLVTDGAFGSKTETALVAAFGKTSIASQADFDALKNKCSQKSLLPANLDYAWKLVDAFKKGCTNAPLAPFFTMPRTGCTYKSLVVRQNVTIRQVSKNFQNIWVETGKSLQLYANKRYSLADYEIASATNDGRLRIYVNKGSLLGNYITPSGLTLSQYFDIE